MSIEHSETETETNGNVIRIMENKFHIIPYVSIWLKIKKREEETKCFVVFMILFTN
jgi:hypothetical protein